MSIKPYTIAGLQTTHLYVDKQADVWRNLELIKETFEGIHYIRVEFPIRLVCIAEGAIQTFVDSREGWDHGKNAREGLMNTTVPGKETDFLGELARKWEVYLCGQLRAKDPEFKYDDRYFNILFCIDPNGEVILKYHKLQTFALEPSVVPTDVWDDFGKVYGHDLKSLFPVARTEIGNIGMMECYDTSFPEVARGLAMNGAEILYGPTYAEPWVGRGIHEVQLRARALDNNCYVVAPNAGDWYLRRNSPVPTQIHGGDSMIVDYMGQIMNRHRGDGNACITATVDIEALRYWRTNVSLGAWLRDLRTEQYRCIYDQPIYPNNRCQSSPPGPAKDRLAIEKKVVEELVRRGIYTASTAYDQR